MMTPGETRFSPLAKAGMALVVLGSAAGVLSLKQCESVDRPDLGEEAAPATTTTLPERQPGWYERYGWNLDWAEELTRQHLEENLGTDTKFLIGAGRCAVTRYVYGDGPNDGWYRIIQNPILFSTKHEGVRFTTFTGLMITDDYGEDHRYFTPSMVRLVEGDTYWGSFGIVPNQTDVIDQRSRLDIESGGEIIPVVDEIYTDLNEFAVGPAISSYTVGRVIDLALNSRDLVSDYCLTPAVLPDDEADSVL